MLTRSLVLALLALAVAAPGAHARTLGDLFIHDYGPADGVTVGHAGDTQVA